jgi:hypothetical protein
MCSVQHKVLATMIYPRLHRSFLLLIGILLTVSAQAQDDDYQQKLTDLKLEQQQLRTELHTTSAALQRLQQQAEATEFVETVSEETEPLETAPVMIEVETSAPADPVENQP